MRRSTGIGAGENKMSEHTGHGSFMWRSTRVRAGGNKMIRVHGTFATRCEEALRSEQERIKCRSTQDMAHSYGEALGWEQEMLNDWST